MKSSSCLALQPATLNQLSAIWAILLQAIERRREEGSRQWQNGYPNPEVLRQDIDQGHGFALMKDGQIAVYGALIFNHEPSYENIDGRWLSTGDFLVVHRVAVAEAFRGQGLVQAFFAAAEEHARLHHVYSVKVDTNFDNAAMLHILHRLGYTHCGEVQLPGGSRLAFEKVLKP